MSNHHATRPYGNRAPTVGTANPPRNATSCQHATCQHPAIMMPGYKRACAEHIPHMLRDSLLMYQSTRQAAQKLDTPAAHHIDALLTLLEGYIRVGH
jgi:hypothetical protein